LVVTAVPDILSQGGGRELGPWPRRVVVAVAVLALLAVAIVHYRPRGTAATARSASATATGRPTGTAPPGGSAVTLLPPPTAVSGAISGDGAVAVEPDGITGPVSSWPSGLRLLAAGQRPAWFWPATGQVEQIAGLPPQRSGYQFTRVQGGWAAQAAPAAPNGPVRAVYFLADAGRSVVQVGSADAVAPGETGTLWLTSDESAQEVSITGRTLGPRVSLPAGYGIAQGTDRGLLLAPLTEQQGTMADELWNPAAHRSTRTFDNVIAASATQIAWAPPCTGRCRVQVLDLPAGRQLSAELPPQSTVASAAFSPDDQLLALQVGFGDNNFDGQLAVQLELLSMTTGRLTVVPQTWASSDALVGFGWPAGDDRLVAELSFPAKVQLASWQPGATHLAIAALAPASNRADLVIGQNY
jgi:hypothetical protein